MLPVLVQPPMPVVKPAQFRPMLGCWNAALVGLSARLFGVGVAIATVDRRAREQRLRSAIAVYRRRNRRVLVRWLPSRSVQEARNGAGIDTAAPGKDNVPAELGQGRFLYRVGAAVAEARLAEHADPVVDLVIAARKEIVPVGRHGLRRQAVDGLERSDRTSCSRQRRSRRRADQGLKKRAPPVRRNRSRRAACSAREERAVLD